MKSKRLGNKPRYTAIGPLNGRGKKRGERRKASVEKKIETEQESTA